MPQATPVSQSFYWSGTPGGETSGLVLRPDYQSGNLVKANLQDVNNHIAKFSSGQYANDSWSQNYVNTLRQGLSEIQNNTPSGYAVDPNTGNLTTQAALDEEASNKAAVASGTMKNIGTDSAPLYVKTGTSNPGSLNTGSPYTPENVKFSQQRGTVPNPTPTPATGANNASGSVQEGTNYPTQDLHPGMSGDAVKQLQQYLNGKGYKVPITGYYGGLTKSAVAQMQQDLNVDTQGYSGFFGPKTRDALEGKKTTDITEKANEQQQKTYDSLNSKGADTSSIEGVQTGVNKVTSTTTVGSTDVSSLIPDGIDDATKKSLVDTLTKLNNAATSLTDPTVTTETLQGEYQKLINEKTGSDNQSLADINLQLMNVSNVMKGTEDDIRKEIKQAGGIATESQILGLTDARNRTMLIQADQLQNAAALKQDYVDKMINFFQIDQQTAHQKIEDVFNINKTIGDFYMNLATLKLNTDKTNQLKWVRLGTDDMGQPLYGFVDPKTGQVFNGSSGTSTGTGAGTGAGTGTSSGGGNVSYDTQSIIDAIKQTETGGNYNAPTGGAGERGAYQYLPSTWQQYADEYAKANGINQSLAFTPENQDKVTSFKVNQWLSQGYNAQQIATLWNTGHLDGTPTAGYMDRFMANLESGTQVAGSQTSATPLENIPPNPNGINPNALKGLSPQLSNVVKLLSQYKYPLPSGFALRTPYFQRLLELAIAYDPSFDATQYNARVKLRASFTSGTDSQNITSINTAIKHIDTLKKAMDKLSWDFSRFIPGAEKFDPNVTAYDVAVQAVASELTRVFRGSGGSLEDVNSWKKSMSHTSTVDSLKSGLNTGLDLLGGRISAMGQKWENGMGSPKDFHILNPDSLKILQNMGVDMDMMGDTISTDTSSSYGVSTPGGDTSQSNAPDYTDDSINSVLGQ